MSNTITASASSASRVVIVPGNGAGDVTRANWYGWLQRKLKEAGVEALLENMPDPVVARETYWIPFMEKDLGCDETTVIVGHSSGAEAAMRYAETHKVHAIVLVSPCHTDLGMESEAASGYYSRPWLWADIKANTQVIAQFSSKDDPFIPWAEQQEVHEQLDSRLHAYDEKGHFMSSTCPDLFKCVMGIVKDREA